MSSLSRETARQYHLKPLAWAILLALSCGDVHAQTGIGRIAPQILQENGVARKKTPEKEPRTGHAITEEKPRLLLAQNDATELNTVTVFGQGETRDEAGRSDVYFKDVSNVYAGKDEIERYKGSSVGDLFKGLNGVYSGDVRNSGALDPNIRGIQGEGRIPVTVDGTEQATSVWLGPAGVANRNYVDPNMISSIMVEKGPSMSPGIKSGVGGTVEIRTIDVDDIIRPGESFGLEIKTETATNSIRPDTSGLNLVGKDYRDVPGAYAESGKSIMLGNGRPGLVRPRSGSRDTNFSFDDKAFRVAAATRQEHFELLGAYSYRSRGNYFSGKGGSHRYETDGWLDQARSDAQQVSGEVNTSYLANIFLPGHEVPNTSSKIETTLLKGTLFLPNDQRLKLSFMRTDQEFGEAVPYMISRLVRLNTNDPRFLRDGAENVGFQFPYSEVKQDTYNLGYAWQPDNPLIDFQANVWATNSDTRRHQNGDELFGTRESDVDWDRYWQCQYINVTCGNAPATLPEKQPNTDGRYNIYPKALQISSHDRWGVNLSNRFRLHPTLNLTLAGDFTREKLRQRDAVESDANNELTWGNRHMGPRSGKREQYNFAFNFDWAATSWLQLSAGARYSDYWSFDSDLDRHRKNQDNGWEARRQPVGLRIAKERTAWSESEFSAFEGNLRNEFQQSVDLFTELGFTPDMIESMLGTADEFVASSLENARLYRETELVVPYDGFKIDPAKNPLLNGASPDATTTLPDGSVVQKYDITAAQAVLGDEPADRWERPEKRRGHAWAPMLGATVFLTDHARVYARYAEFVRFPSIYEDTQAAFGYGYGNVYMNDMKPERSINWEIGYAHDLTGFFPSLRHADIKINYFNNQINDYVDRDYNFQIVQYDKKKISGIELQARVDTGRYFAGFGATYRLTNKLCDADYAATLDPLYNRAVPSCVTARFPTSFARTSLQPQYSLNLDADMRLLSNKLEVGARMVYHASAKNNDEADMIRNGVRYADAFNRPYNWQPIWVFDAYASYQVNDQLSVDFGINNITNRYYLDPMARTLMPAPGRTMKLGLTARF